MAFLSEIQLAEIGFSSLGCNVFISDKASIYGAERIQIGSNVRIDDFCVLSAGEGGIEIGSYIHIAVYSSLIGAGKITLSDYCNISSRVAVYSSNDDYSGKFMTNPMISSQYTNVYHASVFIDKHVVIGSGSVILPGCTLSQGTVIGALSLVSEDYLTNEMMIYAGVPARVIKKRHDDFLMHELAFTSNVNLTDK